MLGTGIKTGRARYIREGDSAMNERGRFEQQVLPYLDAAYNLARWLTRNEHDAEDVVQEAFMRAMRYFSSLKGAEARPWLLTIVRNTCYTWIAKNRPAELVAMDEGGLEAAAETHGTASGFDGNPEVVLLRSANRKLVNQALEELPVAYREIVVMREIEDLSYKEIAAIAGIPAGTVMSRLSRGRDLLRRAIELRLRRAG
jgi:RNA polymerase sigma-70 factor (ECF subfamily)